MGDKTGQNSFLKNEDSVLDEGGEHILVGLSSAPSNAKIVETASQMAKAFRASFTALFVKTPDTEAEAPEDRERLQSHIKLAEELGASVITVFGDDVPFQIAEYARISGATKIVVGRSAVARRSFFGRPTIADRLIAMAPNVDIFIIPDGAADLSGIKARLFGRQKGQPFLRDILISLVVLGIVSAVGYLFSFLGFTEANIITVYILGVLITSVITGSKICWVLSAVASVLVFNFLFTEPRFSLLAYDRGYPVTFLIMLASALITGSLASKMKNQAKQASKAAYRTKILFEANQLLQKASSEEEITDVTAKQLNKLLNRSIVVCRADKEAIGEPLFYGAENGGGKLSERALEALRWTCKNGEKSGTGAQTIDCEWTFFPVRSEKKFYGAIGIDTAQHPLDSFDSSILLSVLGECGLALENNRNAKEKELAAVLAKNEQLRADLLRAISHDLRTPLTAISGNANNLMANGDSFDEETRRQIYTDIYDDSMWLINLVENLLSVTRLEEGKMNLSFTAELMDEVVAEALRHINRKKIEHVITTDIEDFLFARMDARLIVQVIINIVENAIKYTPPGSHIRIAADREGDCVRVRISDDGPGIPDEVKPRVFDMFYTGTNRIADSRRSLGLGLALCKSILDAHGGEISVSDNVPGGSVFTFTLPVSEVTIHESTLDLGR